MRQEHRARGAAWTGGSPTFTVVIPAYDRPDLLARALRSVLAQTLDDFEVLVVDDASPRPVVEVTEGFEKQRIRVSRLPVNRGSAAARNAGIRLARGEWIVFLDDDDELMPDFLERTVQTIIEARPEPSWTWSGNITVDDRDPSIILSQSIWRPKFENLEEAYLGFLSARKIGTNCGLAVRRECFESVGLFDERLRGAEDTDLLVRLARAYPFAVVPEPLVRIHNHAGPQVRRNLQAQARAYRRIVAKHSHSLREHPGVAARMYYKVAWLHYHAGEPRWGRAFFLRALQRRPASVRTWLALASFEILGPLARPAHLAVARLKKRLASGTNRRAGRD